MKYKIGKEMAAASQAQRFKMSEARREVEGAGGTAGAGGCVDSQGTLAFSAF